MGAGTAVEAAVQRGDVGGGVVLIDRTLGQVDVAFCLVHEVVGHHAVVDAPRFVNRAVEPTKSGLSLSELNVGWREVLLVFQKRIGEFRTIHDCGVL